MPSLYKPISSVLQSLEVFLKTRSTEAMQAKTSTMTDVPCGAWSPTFRREAEAYISGQHYVAEEDGDGNLFIAMRRDAAALPHAQRRGHRDMCTQLGDYSFIRSR